VLTIHDDNFSIAGVLRTGSYFVWSEWNAL